MFKMSRSRMLVELALAQRTPENEKLSAIPIIFCDDANMTTNNTLQQQSNNEVTRFESSLDLASLHSESENSDLNAILYIQESTLIQQSNNILQEIDLNQVSCNIPEETYLPLETHVIQENLVEIEYVDENDGPISNDSCINESIALQIENDGPISNDSCINESIALQIENDGPISNDSFIDSGSDSSSVKSHGNERKRRKRCEVDKSAWADSKNALNREKGKQYFGRKKQNEKWDNKVLKNARKMKPRCKCVNNQKNIIKCSEITEEDRKKMFNAFWLMNWGEKKIYIDSLIKMMPTVRPRDRKTKEKSKRTCSFFYYLKVGDNLYRVCKTMFLNTLDIGKTAVWGWKNCSKENFAVARECNESTSTIASKKKTRKNAFEDQNKSLKEFLVSLPKMESHYCRKETSKQYLLPEWVSKKALYDYYISDWCSSKNITAVSIAKFNNTLETENISLFRPKKDECALCMSHKLGLIDDNKHKLHIMRKDEARIEKTNDKNSEHGIVIAVDVQALLSAPKSNVSSLYYKSKLNIHNFCAFDLKTKEAYCFLWNEVEGGVSAEEFSSVVVKLILEKLIPQIDNSVHINKKIIIYSDGCAAQNRNVTIANALLNVAITKNIVIEQKYLEVGHTQMEVDSMHACIENRLRNKSIHVPAEYVGICLSARKNPRPYCVEYLTHSFFKSFADVKFVKSIRPGRKAGDLKVNDIRALQYTPTGNIYYKTTFKEEWQLLPQRREAIEAKEFKFLPNLYQNRLLIPKRKFQDLQDLKLTIPSDYHTFYDNLPHH